MGFLSQLGDGAIQLGDCMKETDRMAERAKRTNMLTLDACIQKAYEQKKEYPQITGFIVTLKHLGMSDADGLEIVVAYMDKNRKAITLDGQTALAYIRKVNTVDEKLLNLLDGNSSAIYEL